MRLHGGYEPAEIGAAAIGAAAIAAESTSSQTWVRQAPAVGYRNLFGPVSSSRTNPPDPTRQDAFQGYGFAENKLERTVELLKKLAKRMEEPFTWSSIPTNSREPDDNPAIPAGYTYLAQFLTHDLTFVGSTLPSVNDPLLEQRNLRTIALNLETIYGGGPLERPSSFSVEESGAPRHRLRVGVFAETGRNPPSDQARRKAFARDLPRAVCPATTSDSAPRLSTALTEVLISDPRNDDHLIISQTAALFHLLHNAVCDILGNAPAPGLAGRRLFAAARRLVTDVYREIIRSDLMKRLLCKAVYDRYSMFKDPFIDRQGDTTIPVEFSHAAFRVGHAMVRPAYQIRDETVRTLDEVLSRTSQAMPDRMPQRSPWIIRWSHFYEIGATPANLSRRISPSFARALFTSRVFDVSGQGTGLGAAQTEMLFGLPRRDLVRGATVYMRSVESLIRHIADAVPGLVAGSRLLSDRDHRREIIARYLAGGRMQATNEPFTEEDIRTLSADPPLFFFVLLEAAVEQDGLRLGLLGSIIVAEVVFRALESPVHFEADDVPQVSELSRLVFPGGAPSTMPDLIGFLDQHYGFTQNGPEFV